MKITSVRYQSDKAEIRDRLFLRKHKQKSKSALGYCYGLFILCASGHKTQNLQLWVMKTAGNNVNFQESSTKLLMFTSIAILILIFNIYFFLPNPLMITYLLINQPGPPSFCWEYLSCDPTISFAKIAVLKRFRLNIVVAQYTCAKYNTTTQLVINNLQ